MASPRLHRGLVGLSASAIAAVYLAGYLRTQSADANLAPPLGSAAAAAPVSLTAPAPTFGPTPRPVAGAASSAPTAPPVGNALPAGDATPAGNATPAGSATPAGDATPAANASPAEGAAGGANAQPGSPAQAGTGSQAAGNSTQAESAQQLGYKDGTYTGQGSSRRGGVVVSVVVQGGRIASVTISSSTLQYPVRDIAGLPAQVVARQSAQVDTVSRATYSSQAFRGAVSQALAKAV